MDRPRTSKSKDKDNDKEEVGVYPYSRLDPERYYFGCLYPSERGCKRGVVVTK